MKRWALIWVLFGLAAAAPCAIAQTSSVVVFGSLDGHQPVSSLDVPIQASGQLTVSFHGDPATGCAAQGTCGYSGTVVFRPGSGADLGLVAYRIHGRPAYQAQLNLPPVSGETFTAAHVTRAGGGVCSDASQPDAELPGTVVGDQMTIRLIQRKGGLLSTRCAGPLDADLAGLGPQIRLTVGQLRNGRRTLPLSGSWSFATGGFAGTIESNLTMTLGKPSIARPTRYVPKAFQQDRQVTETLTLVRATGSLSLALGSDPSACQFLDSCGVQGTLDGTVASQGATASLIVLGPSKRPYADFLAALGRSRRGNPRGLAVEGVLSWPGGGTVTERLQAGSCTSSAPLPGGMVFLASDRRRMTARYSLAGSPRTRCPGPELAQFQTVASGGASRAIFGQPTFTLHLSGSGPLNDDGYTINQRTTLTLMLKPGRVHQQTFLAPAG